MAEYDEYDDGTDESTSGDEDLKSLRRAAGKSKRLSAENESLRRELAFAKSGIDLNDRRMTYFIKGYEGDLEPDSIRAAAVEAGFIAAPEQSPEAQSAARTEGRIREAAAASSAPPGLDPEQQLEQAMAEGGINAMLSKAQELGVPINS